MSTQAMSAIWSKLALVAATVSAVVVVVVVGFGQPSSLCVEVEHAIDPLSSLHVDPGTSVIYTTDPPTSGPHLDNENLSGLMGGPQDELEIVTALEGGEVVIEFDRTSENPARLIELADDAVVLVPVERDGVQARAWGRLLTCPTVDVEAVSEFARTNRLRSRAHE